MGNQNRRQICKNCEQLQIQVDEQSSELREARNQLLRKERLAVLGELSGSVAHELRNPLGAIKNSILYLQLTQQIDAKAAAHLARMNQDIERSDRVIKELLDYTRPLSIERRRLPLQEMVESALAEFEMPDDIAVERRLEPHPLMVEVDTRHVQQIMGNLLTNAVQAMPDGGTLRVECLRREAEAVVAVSDTGGGISVQDLPRVFEPLFTTKTYGIGLGLALSQRYARLYQGRLELQSESGQGATFELALPVASQ